MRLAAVGALLVADEGAHLAFEAALEPDLLVAVVADGGASELDSHEAVTPFLLRAAGKHKHTHVKVVVPEYSFVIKMMQICFDTHPIELQIRRNYALPRPICLARK